MDDEPREQLPDRAPYPEFTPAHALAWIAGAFVMMGVSAMLLFAVRPHSKEDAVMLAGLSAIVFLLASSFLLSSYPGGRRASAALGVRPTSPLLLGLGLLLGLVSQLPADRLRRVVEHFFPVSEAEAAARAHLLEPSSTLHAVALVVSLAVLVPLAEETFFRGAVFGALRRSGRSGFVAAIVTGLGFTLSHFDQRLWLAIAFMACILGFVRATSGSLLPGLALHVGFNGLAAVGAVTGLTTSDSAEIPLRFELAVWGLLVVLLLIFAWSTRGRGAWSNRRAEEFVGV